MKLNSKYFDGIRVKQDRGAAGRGRHARQSACEWPGCSNAGTHPAPKGRGREGQYFRFCLEHVREYNKNYNYFKGMGEQEIRAFQEGNVTGHRPTWAAGGNAHARGAAGQKADAEQAGAAGAQARGAQTQRRGFRFGFSARDPFGLFGRATRGEQTREEMPRRPIRNMERKCLTQLNLDEWATKEEIKARFKELVKRHHPDSNGGDRGSEEKLREVIAAYNYLKKSGLC